MCCSFRIWMRSSNFSITLLRILWDIKMLTMRCKRTRVKVFLLLFSLISHEFCSYSWRKNCVSIYEHNNKKKRVHITSRCQLPSSIPLLTANSCIVYTNAEFVLNLLLFSRRLLIHSCLFTLPCTGTIDINDIVVGVCYFAQISNIFMAFFSLGCHTLLQGHWIAFVGTTALTVMHTHRSTATKTHTHTMTTVVINNRSEYENEKKVRGIYVRVLHILNLLLFFSFRLLFPNPIWFRILVRNRSAN